MAFTITHTTDFAISTSSRTTAIAAVTHALTLLQEEPSDVIITDSDGEVYAPNSFAELLCKEMKVYADRS